MLVCSLTIHILFATLLCIDPARERPDLLDACPRSTTMPIDRPLWVPILPLWVMDEIPRTRSPDVFQPLVGAHPATETRLVIPDGPIMPEYVANVLASIA